MPRTITGRISRRPTHMTTMNTHFERSGMEGFTYPVVIPQELMAETISKTRSVNPNAVICTCRTIIVAMKTMITERMMTSILFDSSGSATSIGMFLPSYLNGTSTLLRTKARLNHQMIPR